MLERSYAALALVTAALPAFAASPHTEALMELVRANAGSDWILVVRDRDLEPSWGVEDEIVVRLRADRDLGVLRLKEMAAWPLWDAWIRPKDVHCLLVSRDGKTLMELSGVPTGADLLEKMTSGDYQTVWERRDAFLREHRDNGELLDAKLATSLRLMRVRMGRSPWRRDDDPQAGPEMDRMYQETADTLEQLMQLPDWWRLPHLGQFCQALDQWNAGRSPRMRGLLSSLRKDALTAWTRNPRSGGRDVGTLWVALERALENGQVASVPDLLPSPGEIWPRRAEVNLLARGLWEKSDWRGLEVFLTALPTAIPGAACTPYDWKDYVERQIYVHLLATVALGKQGLWKDAEIAAHDLWFWSGEAWPRMVAGLREAFAGDRLPPSDTLRSLLQLQPGEPWPVPPAEPPLRMIRSEAAGAGWDRLMNDDGFAVWGPDELLWATATPEEAAFMVERGARLALFRGPGQPLTSWAGLGKPGTIVSALEALDTPRLAWLDAFIERDPTHLDARRKRYLTLLERRPIPRLEANLALDAAATLLPAPATLGGSPPTPALWSEPLVRAMPDLEAALKRWPSTPWLWRTWVSWAPLHPAHPSPQAFVLSIPVPEPRSRWLCALPVEIHAAVKAELIAGRRQDEIRDWFKEAWSGLDLALEDLPQSQAPAQVEMLYRYLRAALEASGAQEDVPGLDAQRAALLARLQRVEAIPEVKLGPFQRVADLPVPGGLRR